MHSVVIETLFLTVDLGRKMFKKHSVRLLKLQSLHDYCHPLNLFLNFIEA